MVETNKCQMWHKFARNAIFEKGHNEALQCKKVRAYLDQWVHEVKKVTPHPHFYTIAG